VTTFSDRVLLRWLPLAVFLAAAMAVGLTLGPHPFAYHRWPQPPRQTALQRVVEVPAAEAPATVWSAAVSPGAARAGSPQRSRQAPARAKPLAPAAPARVRHAAPRSPASGTGRHDSGHAPRGDRGDQAGGRAPHEQPDTGPSQGPGPGAGTPLAQLTRALPPSLRAKLRLPIAH
jgi:hypothetical protein